MGPVVCESNLTQFVDLIKAKGLGNLIAREILLFIIKKKIQLSQT
jgi:hypothetical protein